MAARIHYSREELLALRYTTSLQSQHCTYARQASCRLQQLIRRRRPRGKRAGRRHYKIKVVVNVFPRQNFYDFHHCSSPSVSKSNLRQVRMISSTNSKRHISCTLWNARSIEKKLPAVADSILQNNTDLFIVTETWFNALDDTVKARFSSILPGHSIHQVPRTRRKGGGTAVIGKANLQVTLNKSSPFKTFEILDANVRLSSAMIRLLVIYRPPNSCKHTVSDFLNEFTHLLEVILHAKGNLIIVGDFNIHVDDLRDRDALKFVDCLNSFGLEQHVQFSTHDKGHTLDLIITRSSDTFISTITNDWLLPSDHASLHFNIMSNAPPPSTIMRTSRRLRNVNLDNLKEMLSSSLSILPSDDKSATHMAENYNDLLRAAIDNLAPPVTKVFINKQRAPWYTIELIDERKKLRRLERKWKTTGLVVHKDIFKAARSVYSGKLHEMHAKYHRERIQNADQKSLFTIIDDMIGNKKIIARMLPDIDISELPNTFAKFFRSKIAKIRHGLPSVVPSDFYTLNHCLSSFTPVSIDFVSKLINTLPPKSCGPTHCQPVY
ncbi:uncharacterized protein [Ptychodera flava]|uniref:uncharacterized protein n=1 Tax=Ptychodera flava TaxID=63121 RepID=UPI003969DEB0